MTAMMSTQFESTAYNTFLDKVRTDPVCIVCCKIWEEQEGVNALAHWETCPLHHLLSRDPFSYVCFNVVCYSH